MQESSGPVLGECNHPATSFPLSDSGCILPNGLAHTGQNQPTSNLVLADCARFWPNGSSLEASQCARITRPTTGQLFQSYPIWIECESDPACLLGEDQQTNKWKLTNRRLPPRGNQEPEDSHPGSACWT